MRFDRRSGDYMLLAPERGFRLNASAAAILSLCDGEHSVLQIVQGLAPPEHEAQVLEDVVALVEQLKDGGLLTLTDP